MAKRKHRNQIQWRDLIEKQARSELNGAAFYEQHGLSPTTFYRHRKAQEGKAADSVSSQFVKVQPRAVPTMPVQQALVGAMIATV